MGSGPIRNRICWKAKRITTPKRYTPEKDLCLVSDVFLKLENIKPNKIKVSEMGKYFDVLRIICHTEKKEEMESHQNR